MMQTSRYKKFLEVIFGRLSLSLEMAFDSRYELLAGITSFLIVITIMGHHCNATGSALLSLLATLSTFPGAFDGDIGGCGTAIVGSRSHITRDEGNPDHLFTQSVSSYDVEYILGGF
jgi:hypothetical protein